jgi:hypothetical protein
MNEVGPLTNFGISSPRRTHRNGFCAALFSLFILLSFSLFISCQKDSTLEKVCADPIGSQDVTMGNNTQFCPLEGQNGCFKTQFGSTTQVFQAINYSGKLLGMITDVGVVTCLGQVTVKPATGYVYTIDVVAKHGYIIKLPDGTFGRLFVDSVTKSSSGAVTKIYVTWQYSF